MCLFEEPEGGGVLISIVVLLGKLLAACVIFYLLELFVLKKVFGAFARSLELLYLGSMGPKRVKDCARIWWEVESASL